MADDTGKYSSIWLYGMLLVGACIGGAVYYFFDPKEPCPPAVEQPGARQLSCFDAKAIDGMVGAPDAWGARFYLAKGTTAGFAVLAAPIGDDGIHVPDISNELRFYLFKALRDESTEMVLLPEAEAERAVKDAAASGRASWSLDVRTDVLRSLLATAGANAIGLMDRRTSDGVRTFELAPVKIAGSQASPVGTIDDVLVGSGPCPLNCPRDPGAYLHMR
jgi:hypothetical protein